MKLRITDRGVYITGLGKSHTTIILKIPSLTHRIDHDIFYIIKNCNVVLFSDKQDQAHLFLFPLLLITTVFYRFAMPGLCDFCPNLYLK